MSGNVSRFQTRTFRLEDITPTASAPEPATWAMMLLGFAGLGAELRRRRAAAA